MQEPSIFTRILRGEIHQEILYQDDLCFVILTHEPLSPGHSLVIPKVEVGHLWDLPDETYHHLMDVCKKVATKMRSAYSYPRIGMIVEGFGVASHAHIHVFGYNEGLEATIISHSKSEKLVAQDLLKIEADKLRGL